jgi:cationic amino acid transporter 14
MYLFPYGWKVNGPASDETGIHVIRLVGVLFVLVIIFDVIMAWYISAIDWGNHFIVILFFGILVAIIACILAISRQPQIRYSYS